MNFKVNSSVLSAEAKAALDEIATQAKGEKGYLIQVTGYASADGGATKNRALSERRAEHTDIGEKRHGSLANRGHSEGEPE